jgi:integrase
MADILPGHTREWVSSLQDAGLSPASIAKLRFILSSIFTTALNDRVVNLHPCKGVKTPTIAKRPLQIITPEQFDLLYASLRDADTQLLVDTDIETGMRWGELTELRVKDLDRRRRAFTIARAVVQVDPKFHPQGERFLVRDYPKDGEHRRVKISAQLVDKIAAHVHAEGLGPDDLLFRHRAHRENATLQPPVRPDPEILGFTNPNDKGRTYRHGTLSGYNAGRCRCRDCKDAYAKYRLQRRRAGKDRSDRSPLPHAPARTRQHPNNGTLSAHLEDHDEATIDAFENVPYRAAAARRNS